MFTVKIFWHHKPTNYGFDSFDSAVEYINKIPNALGIDWILYGNSGEVIQASDSSLTAQSV